MKVARVLIGQFRGRQHVGHPRSVERKGNCVVCQAIMKRKKLPTKANRHDCRMLCEHCSVYLCMASG